MKRGQLIWGVLCLALAGMLVTANLALPAEEVVFTVGSRNIPYVPPVVLGIVGIVLLAAARHKSGKSTGNTAHGPRNEEKSNLNKRLETIGWGSFVLMLGCFMLVPHTIVARGVWSIGVGAIMLGLNAARYFYRIRLSGLTTFLGVVSVLVGIAQLAGVHTLEDAALFIVLGAYLVLKSWFDRREIFGKAEQS